jgi:hypothetical protein
MLFFSCLEQVETTNNADIEKLGIGLIRINIFLVRYRMIHQ